MRHVYIRGILALIWLSAAIFCGVTGNVMMTLLYILIGGIFLYSAYSMWKKEKKNKGEE